jgi:hypothetical protein
MNDSINWSILNLISFNYEEIAKNFIHERDKPSLYLFAKALNCLDDFPCSDSESLDGRFLVNFQEKIIKNEKLKQS